jgi:PAS domain S-box-containing protein
MGEYMLLASDLENETGQHISELKQTEKPLNKAKSRYRLFACFSWLAIPLLATATIILWAADIRTSYESPYLLMALNFVFSALVSFFIAYLVGRSFLVNGAPGLLLLGCGIITWGAGGFVGTVAGLVSSAGKDFTDILVTIHNTSVWLSAICCLTGVILSLRPRRRMPSVRFWLASSYSIAIGAIGFTTLAAIAKWLPTFFVQGQGGTQIRQFVLASTIGMFALTASLLGVAYRRSRSPFAYWYSLALWLLAIGLFGVMMQPSAGSPLSWVGRASQFLGGAYILIAAISSVRESHVWGIPLEEALTREPAFISAVLKTVGALVIVLDREGRIVSFNRACEEMTGYSFAEIRGRCFWDLLLPADEIVSVMSVFGQIRGGQVPNENENLLVAKDGSRHMIHWTNGGLTDSFGAVEYVIGTGIDVTERKRAEEALAAAYMQLQSVIDNTTSLVYALDLEERFVMANSAVAKVLDSTPEQMIGKRRHELMPKEDADWHEANDRKVIEAGGPMELEEYSRLKGRSITWLTTKFPLRDTMGKIYAVAGISTDISERKKTESQLHDSEERLQLTLQASAVGTFEVDLTTGTGRWNEIEYELLGLKPGDVTAAPETFFRYVHPDDIAELSAQWEEATRTGRLDAEFRVIRADGQERWLAGKGQFAFAETSDAESANGKKLPVRFLGVNFDITERKLAEEALRCANEELEARVQERTKELAVRAKQLRALAGELTISEQRERKRLSTLLHDHLQQLLVGAKYRLSVLAKIGDAGIKTAAKDVEELIDESIKSSRSLTAELSPPILHDAGINVGLEWLCRRMADTQGLFVDLTAEQTGPLPEDLTVLLFEAVRELLFNVAKHASTQSACIRLCCMDGSLQLTVSDEGIGFDPHALPPPGEKGKGFGLFSIGERLELFGGKLEIDSAPGRGSRFVLSVPIAVVESQSHAITESPMEIAPELINKHAQSRKIRVLLADDHAVVRQGISNLLSDAEDIEVIGMAADGHEVINLAAKLLPDVILMDMSMPKLNGVEATRLIHRDYADIRIIGLSMFEETEKAQEMRDAGAVNYLSKSGPAEELISAIRMVVDRSQKHLVAKT